MTARDGFRAGFVAVVGRPNVGKSTLINELVGRKISIVTPKPQTTRHRILAIRTDAVSQVVFVDTPGLHRDAGRAMNRLMNRAASNALEDADLVLFVLEAGRWSEDDRVALERLQNRSRPVIAVLNKIDKMQPREALLAAIADAAARYEFTEVVPVSARRHENLDRLLEVVVRLLPESPPLFPEDQLTDRSDAFLAAEVIREKLTLALRQEIPYGLAVQIERFERQAGGITVNALIWVERDSHKGIVVGKGGSMLKKTGRSARLALNREFGVPVHLELWVKVKENWADSEEQLRRLGYDPG